jgi:hypothetical protein
MTLTKKRHPLTQPARVRVPGAARTMSPSGSRMQISGTETSGKPCRSINCAAGEKARVRTNNIIRGNDRIYMHAFSGVVEFRILGRCNGDAMSVIDDDAVGLRAADEFVQATRRE